MLKSQHLVVRTVASIHFEFKVGYDVALQTPDSCTRPVQTPPTRRGSPEPRRVIAQPHAGASQPGT